MWGFPKIRGTILGVPILRMRVFGGLYWGPPILGNYHVHIRKLSSKQPSRVKTFSGNLYMGYSPNSLKGVTWGIIQGSGIRVIKGMLGVEIMAHMHMGS